MPVATFTYAVSQKGFSMNKNKEEFSWFSYTLALLIENGQSWIQSVYLLLPTLSPGLQKELHIFLEKLFESTERKKTFEEYIKNQKEEVFKRFLSILWQCVERGASLAEPLKNLSSDLTFEIENDLERKKHILSTTMLLPLFIFILPSVMLIVFTPLFLYLKKGGFFP